MEHRTCSLRRSASEARNIELTVCFSVFIVCLFFGHSTQAVGVGVKPKEIDLTVKIGRETVTEFLVMNVSDQPAIYQVYPDALEGEIKLGPSDFRLEPGGSQIVKASIIISGPGRYSTNISVVARPLGATGLVAASGVKVPITIDSSGIPIWWLGVGVVLACLVIIFVLLLIKRRNHKLKNRNEVVS